MYSGFISCCQIKPFVACDENCWVTWNQAAADGLNIVYLKHTVLFKVCCNFFGCLISHDCKAEIKSLTFAENIHAHLWEWQPASPPAAVTSHCSMSVVVLGLVETTEMAAWTAHFLKTSLISSRRLEKQFKPKWPKIWDTMIIYTIWAFFVIISIIIIILLMAVVKTK